MTEHSLKALLENALKEQEAAQHKSSTTAPEITGNALLEAESLINMKSNDLEKKKKELVCLFIEYFLSVLNMKFTVVIPQLKQELLDNKVQTLEKEWSMVEEESLKNPSPGT
jgi:hypothetical protein